MLTNLMELLINNPEMLNPESLKTLAGVFVGGLAAIVLAVGSSAAGPALLMSSMAGA